MRSRAEKAVGLSFVIATNEYLDDDTVHVNLATLEVFRNTGEVATVGDATGHSPQCIGPRIHDGPRGADSWGLKDRLLVARVFW
jgi:hypothetical protein